MKPFELNNNKPSYKETEQYKGRESRIRKQLGIGVMRVKMEYRD